MSQSISRQWQRAERYLSENQVAAARAVLESMIARNPNQPQVQLVLGGIAWKQDRVRDASVHALAAATCELSAPDMVCDVVAALMQVGESALASRFFDHAALTRNQLSTSILMRLSGQAQTNGEHVRALGFLERARKAGAGGADFHCFMGVQLTFNGRLEEAEHELEACVQLDPAWGRAALILSRSRTQTGGHNHLQNLDEGLKRVKRGTEDHAALEFARYKELEDIGRCEEAWRTLTRANCVVHGVLNHNPEAEATNLKHMIERTSDWSMSDKVDQADGPRPVFIVGMPRSGTTLLDRILGNHSCVTSAGELADFGWQMRWAVDHRTPIYPDFEAISRIGSVDFAELGRRYLEHTQWRAGNSLIYVDKNPPNWVLAGLIARALPQARILHLVRDPMDVCFSNYRAFLGYNYPYSYDLHCLAQHYISYRRVMAHWHNLFPGRILDVSYRDLVVDASSVARRVFGFCGLEFEPECVDITRNRGAIATLSMVQAREAIHTRSFQQWKRYSDKLETLRASLQMQADNFEDDLGSRSRP